MALARFETVCRLYKNIILNAPYWHIPELVFIKNTELKDIEQRYNYNEHHLVFISLFNYIHAPPLAPLVQYILAGNPSTHITHV